MDISADNQQQTISDDQELAKALAGVNQEANDLNLDSQSVDQLPQTAEVEDQVQPGYISAPVTNESAASTTATPDFSQPAAVSSAADPSLASVKEAALSELRPLVGKLEVSPEEKFNTYLLLIRSTDDKDLIAPAHEAAKSIADEAKKAQALLDIIKEIDFLSSANQ